MRKQGGDSGFFIAAPPVERGAWAETNLDFVEAQPLGEPDQLLSLLHAPHLGTATLNDLGKGS